jgi:hypothetical protein
VWTAAISSEALQEQGCHFGGNSVLKPLGFFVRTRPFQADHIREKLFRQTMPEDQVLRDFPALGTQLNVAITTNPEVTAPSHALERRRDSRGSYAQILGEAGADRDLVFLNELPDRFQVIFLGNAGFFSAHLIFGLPWTAPPAAACHALREIMSGAKTIFGAFRQRKKMWLWRPR